MAGVAQEGVPRLTISKFFKKEVYTWSLLGVYFYKVREHTVSNLLLVGDQVR